MLISPRIAPQWTPELPRPVTVPLDELDRFTPASPADSPLPRPEWQMNPLRQYLLTAHGTELRWDPGHAPEIIGTLAIPGRMNPDAVPRDSHP